MWCATCAHPGLLALPTWLRVACALAPLLLICRERSAADVPKFTIGIELPSQVPTSIAEERALRELGIGYVNYYLSTVQGAKDRPGADVNRAMMALCDRLGVDYSISTYQIDPPDDCVREAAAANASPARTSRFRGMVFDELEHIRLLNYDRPLALANYGGFRTLLQAYDETLAGYRKLHDKYAALSAPVTATHVFPVLLHTAARAGFTPCPKICKELYSPVSLAIGMGAAKQYGTSLWADIDLWLYALVPGHTPEEFRSNLLLAYWLGVDLVYVEGSGFNLYPAGDQGIPFSLMSQVTPEVFRLTEHGEVLRWFCREYVPRHPRPWTFRDVKPHAAIVRLDDTDCGQLYMEGFTKGLFGSDTLASAPDTRAWFGIWNLLTCGKTGLDGITYFKNYAALAGLGFRQAPGEVASYATCPAMADSHRFFVPLNGVVVYDHHAGYDLLKGVPLLFVTGAEIGKRSMVAVKRCVNEGAICVMWGPLARRNGFAGWQSGVLEQPEGKGKWVITDDFNRTEVYLAVRHLLNKPDEIRYQFGDRQVVLRRVTDNEVSVEVDGAVMR